MKKQLALLLLTFALLAAGSVRAIDRCTLELHNLFFDCTQGDYSQYDPFTDIPRLLYLGADPLWKNEYGLAAVHYAAKYGLEDSLMQEIVNCIKLKGGSIDFPDEKGFSALCHAALEGHVDIIHLLFKNGASLDYKTPEEGFTPLHCAALGGDPGTVEALQGHGAGQVVDTRDRRPGYYARRNSIEVGNQVQAFENRDELQELLR